jgi:putative ABC transport system permease protein
MRVVMPVVGRQDLFEVAAVEDQKPIEALAAEAADPALDVGVRAGCANGEGCQNPSSARNPSFDTLHRFGLPAALTVVGIGVGLLAYGVFASGLETATRLLSLAGGVLLLFLGVALLAPRLVPPLVQVLGAPGARLGGVAGQLASQNAIRDPARTASTAAALMIGLALVTLVAVLGAGLRTSFTSAVDELFVADYALTGEGEPLTIAAGRAAAAAPGVEVVSSIRSESGEAFGEEVNVNGVEPNLSEVVEMTWHRGTGDVPAQLGRDGAFVLHGYAEDHDLELGSPLALTTPSGEQASARGQGRLRRTRGRLALWPGRDLGRKLRRCLSRLAE